MAATLAQAATDADSPTAAAPEATAAHGPTSPASAAKAKPATKGKAPKEPKAPKAAKPAKAPKPAKPRRVSALDAAAQVLREAGAPLRAVDLIDQMQKRGLWQSPGGKTPSATLYAAMTREITTKAGASRFKKGDKGLFVATKV